MKKGKISGTDIKLDKKALGDLGIEIRFINDT